MTPITGPSRSSTRIARSGSRRTSRSSSTGRTARPFEDDLSLKCHVHQDYDSRPMIASGRRPSRPPTAWGARAATGRPSGYLAAHTESGWNGLTDRQKLEGFGMRPTRDLLSRGRICAECHIGKVFGRRQPRPDRRRAPSAQLRVREPACEGPEALAARGRSGPGPGLRGESLGPRPAPVGPSVPRPPRSPSPQGDPRGLDRPLARVRRVQLLLLPSRPRPRLPQAPRGRRPVQARFPWGSWYLPQKAGYGFVFPRPPGRRPSPRSGTSWPGPRPTPPLVAKRARAASDDLGRRGRRAQSRPDPTRPRRSLLADALHDDAPPGPLDWDRAAQRLLAIVAFDKALAESDPGSRARRSGPASNGCSADLDLPIRVERRGELFDSPGRFDPARITDDLRAVRDALSQPLKDDAMPDPFLVEAGRRWPWGSLAATLAGIAGRPTRGRTDRGRGSRAAPGSPNSSRLEVVRPLP